MRKSRTLAVVVVAALAASGLAADAELRKMAKDPDWRKRADAARALARETTADAGALLASLLGDDDPHVRDAAVLACSEVRGDAFVEELASAGRAKEDLTRANAAAALGRTGILAVIPHLDRLSSKDPSPAVRIEALDALWTLTDDRIIGICTAAAKDPDPGVRAAALEAAGRATNLDATELVKGSLADPDEGVRCVARMQLRFVARQVALDTLAAAAKDPSWRIRAQTVEDAAWLREAPAMEALVTLVGDSAPRVAEAAHRELRRLSGKDLGRDPELWKAWWAQAKEGWTPPRGKLKDPDDAAAAGVSRGGATVRYHGLDVATAGAVFVIDASGSMREPIVAGDPTTRAHLARAELLRALGEAPDGLLANVILFQLRTQPCFERATALSKRSRDDIASFSARVTPSDRGDLLAAVLAALQDDTIDTVFLLSDGLPSAGERVDRGRVQAAVRQMNRRRKVAIHTIGFGATQPTQRAFLEGIARDSGGRCVLK